VARAYVGTRISEHIIRDNGGFLICTAPIARSGWQVYRKSEIDPKSNDNSFVRVWRDPSEVTSPATLASVEGKPVTLNHPSGFVNPSTWSWESKGHAQNVRIGPPDEDGNVQLFADLHIQDQALIDRIAHGTRDLSCGYQYEITDGPEPGTYAMRQIRMNHVAVVESGRSGTSRIIDEASARLINKITKGDDEIPEDTMGKTKDSEHEERLARMDRLCDALEKLVSRRSKAADLSDEPETHETLAAAVIPDDDQHNEGVNPVAADARRVLDNLRVLRPAIEAAGDPTAIRDYNRAVKYAKARIAQAIGRAPTARTAVLDGVESESFEVMVERRRRELLTGKLEPTPAERQRVAADRENQPESYQQMVDKSRRKMLNETI
jgi:hypothetical protein